MKRTIAIAWCAGAVCSSPLFAQEEFKPIPFKDYGLDAPSLEFVVGGKQTEKVLSQTGSAVVVKFGADSNLPEGVSLRIDGRVISQPKTLPDDETDEIMSLIRDPMNYGEATPMLQHSGKKLIFENALEMTNTHRFVRMYVDTTLDYCSFYSQEGTVSSYWRISPKLKKGLGKIVSLLKN